MAFDKDSNLPLVQPQKRTTKVNIVMIVSIFVFFALGACAVTYFWMKGERNQPPAASEAKP